MNCTQMLFFLLALFLFYPIPRVTQSGELYQLINSYKISILFLVGYDEENNSVVPLRTGGEFENTLDSGNIRKKMFWSFKRGDNVKVQYHRCFYNPVSCFK